jgi:hypothetical protein
VGRAAAEGLWAPDHRGSARRGPAKVPRRLGGSRNHRRQGIARAEHLTGGGFGFNSGTGRARGRGRSFRKLPGGEAELLRALAGAEVHRSGGSAVEQEVRGGRAEWGSGARVWGGCGVGDEMQRVRGSQIKVGPGTSACGPGARARRRFRMAGARGGGKRGEGRR